MAGSRDAPRGYASARELAAEVDEAQLLAAEEPEVGVNSAKILGEVRTAKRTVTAAALVSALALCGAACAVLFRGGAAQPAPDRGGGMVQLYGRDVQARLSSIENSTADAQAKLEAGVAAIAGNLFDAPEELSRPERVSQGEEMSKAFKAKLEAISSKGGESDSEITHEKMKVQMDALQEAQDRIRSMTKRFSAFKTNTDPQLQDSLPAVDCSLKLNESASTGDIMGFVSACSSSGGWYRVYIDTIMREGEGFDTPVVRTLPVGTLVHVVETAGRRVKVDMIGNKPEDAVPTSGWVSSETADNVVILRPSRSAALFYELGGNHTSMMGRVFQNAKLLAARKGFARQFKTTADATAMQHDLAQRIKSIDPARLAAGLSRMEANKAKTEQDVEKMVKETVTGTEEVLEKDADKVVGALDDAPAAQKLVKEGAKVLEGEVAQQVEADLKPDKLLSGEGKDLLKDLGVSFGR